MTGTGLEWLRYLCPERDGFTEELNDALRQLDERDADEEEFPSPGLNIVLRADGFGFEVTRG